jgi:hypothetical protein
MIELFNVLSIKHGLPYWWVESIVVEYLDCRILGENNKIYQINFEGIKEKELDAAIHKHKIIMSNPVIHNIDKDVLGRFVITSLVGKSKVPLVDKLNDIIPSGMISKDSFRLDLNSLDVVDPKMQIDGYFQVYDEGELWQWKFAEFVIVEGRSYGKWVSEYINLNEFDLITGRFQELYTYATNERLFKEKVNEFYTWLDTLRLPLLEELYRLHLKFKEENGDNKGKISKNITPKISSYEKMTVEDGNIKTMLYAEAIFYELMIENINDLVKILNDSSCSKTYIYNLDNIYKKSTLVLINAAACLESFLNGIGIEYYPDLWEDAEMLNMIGKIKLLLSLNGKVQMFDVGREPFQSISMLVSKRNQLIHFKRQYKTIKINSFNSLTLANQIFDHRFISQLENNLNIFFDLFCKEININKPTWLMNHQT